MSNNHTSKESAKLNSNENGGRRSSLAGELHRSIYGTTQIRSAMLFVLFFAAYALIVVVLTTDLVLFKGRGDYFAFYSSWRPGGRVLRSRSCTDCISTY